MNPESSSAPTRARLGSSPDGWAHTNLWDLDGDTFRWIIVAERLVKPVSCCRGVKVCSVCSARDAFSRNPASEGTMPLRAAMPRPRVSNIRPPGKTPMSMALIEDASLHANGNILQISRLSAPSNGFESFHARSAKMEGLPPLSPKKKGGLGEGDMQLGAQSRLGLGCLRYAAPSCRWGQ